MGSCTCLDLNEVQEHEISTDPLCPVHGRDGRTPALPRDAEPSVGPLYKTTIVVWSRDRTGEDEEEMDLIGVAREATDGMMYAPFNTWTRVEAPEADPDFDAGAQSFFTDPRNVQ